MVVDTVPPPRSPPKRKQEEGVSYEPKPLMFPTEAPKSQTRPPVSKIQFPTDNIVGNGGSGGTGGPGANGTVQSITFPQSGGSGNQPGTGAVPLSFPNRPVMPTKVAVFDDTELYKQEHDRQKVAAKAAKQPGSPLSFGNAPPVRTKAEPPVVKPPTALFESDDNSSVVKAAVKYVQDNFASLNYNIDRIERQIRQLTPLTLDVLSTWGANAITENASLVSESAKLVKQFTELNTAELMDAALKSANAVPQTRGIFSRLLGNDTPTLLSYKPRLMVLKPQLDMMKPKLERLVTSTGEMEKRLMLNVAALAAICDVVGQPADNALNQTMHDRRTMLLQASNQAKLVNLQLDQTRTMIADRMTQLEQILNVTIPALEMANATR